MRLVLIGSGNVATAFGVKLKAAGHDIVQVFSRNLQHAGILAHLLDAVPTDQVSKIAKNADLYIIAVPDNELYRSALRLDPLLVVHTAGSVPMDTLKPVSSNYGVLYPLQTISSSSTGTIEIPLLTDANTENNKKILLSLARSISENVMPANDETRRKLHLAAVLINNFPNHLYSLTEEYCLKENISFNMLLPLIKEGAHRVMNASPTTIQTGPAIRKDLSTIEKHRGLLKQYPVLLDIYDLFTSSLLNKKESPR